MAEPAPYLPPPLALIPRVEWLTSAAPVPYREALEAMEARVEAIFEGEASECVWLLEHPPIYTSGTSADPSELLAPSRFPVLQTGRGGRFTYHGPGQRVAYVMLDLSQRGRDVRALVTSLEDWLIATLACFGVKGERSPDNVGIFVEDAKIASIGIRVRHWVSFHGVSLNVDPDLEHFTGIVPCGLVDTKVTSLADLGIQTDMARVDSSLRDSFAKVFQQDPL
jgi:lipoyl(octanoyl) transferase